MNFNSFNFRHIFAWLIVLLIFIIPQGNTVSAQSILERLEQQIRERVNPAQDGNPSRRTPPNPPPPALAQPQANNKAQANNRLEQVYLGVTADDRKDRGRGVRITDVRPGSPADKAGLRNQDLVIGLTGVRVRQLTDMTEILALYQPNDVVEFEVLRDNKSQKMKVSLGRLPAESGLANQTAEVIPLPPGEMIPSPPVKQKFPNDRETIEQLQKRIVELEQRIAELEQALTEAQKNNK